MPRRRLEDRIQISPNIQGALRSEGLDGVWLVLKCRRLSFTKAAKEHISQKLRHYHNSILWRDTVKH